ncbi:MAG: DUF3078 domain-containing protein [Bacteroidia bacterium]|nr:DUF3078 domain-containing protein [Bacteroidia bacterium]MDW8157260.1 DUF3078 domain-containing protein [Bacteroidia bacterium]
MTTLFFLFCVLISPTLVFTQEASIDTTKTPKKINKWKLSYVANVNFTQSSFTHWAAGGENSFALSALTNFMANYQHKKWKWENTFDLGYGVSKLGDQPFRKNEDKIDIISRIGYQLSKNLFSSIRMNFKTQFAPGFNFPNDSIVVSRFFSPAFLFLSLGIDYKPTDGLSLYASPATGRLIIVLDQALADKGAFGVEKAKFATDGSLLQHGENLRFEFGALLSAQYKKDFNNISIRSRLELFNNYTDRVAANRGNIVVNFENLITFAINKWFSTSLFFHMLYDHNQQVTLFQTIDGKKVEVGKGPRLQIKQVLGVGFNYKISNTPSK